MGKKCLRHYLGSRLALLQAQNVAIKKIEMFHVTSNHILSLRSLCTDFLLQHKRELGV